MYNVFVYTFTSIGYLFPISIVIWALGNTILLNSTIFIDGHVLYWAISDFVKVYIIVENVFYFHNSERIILNLNTRERCRRPIIVDSHMQTTNSVWRKSSSIFIGSEFKTNCSSVRTRLNFGHIYAFRFKVLSHKNYSDNW